MSLQTIELPKVRSLLVMMKNSTIFTLLFLFHYYSFTSCRFEHEHNVVGCYLPSHRYRGYANKLEIYYERINPLSKSVAFIIYQSLELRDCRTIVPVVSKVDV